MVRHPRGIRGDAGFEVLPTMSSHIETYFKILKITFAIKSGLTQKQRSKYGKK
jgi:hypothetical protein